MLQEQEIAVIVAELSAALKAYDRQSDKKNKLPNYNPIYATTVELQQEIAVHSEILDFPDKLFKKKAPNEGDEQWQYRKDNYRPVTLAFWNRALGVMNRVWNENNYEIKWPEESKNNEQWEYLNKTYPKYGKATSYFESIVTKYKINDPNAVLVIKPEFLPGELNEQGEFVALDNVPVSAIAYIYSSDKVIRYDRKFCLFLTEEKSLITKGGTDTFNEGFVFELYDDTNIYKVKQVGKQSDWTFAVEILYNHNLGFIPAQILKGMPLYLNGLLYYKSILYDAVPLLNEALYDFSTLSLSKASAAFPKGWAVVEDCNYQGPNGEHCNGGKIFGTDADGNMKASTCPKCNGSGIVNPFKPGEYLQVRLPSSNLDNQATVPTPPFGFVGPPVDILKWSDATIWMMIGRAFIMQNIDVTADMPGERVSDQTATGRLIDREELFSFLQIFSSEIFDLLDFTFKAIGGMRYGTNWKQPEISKPVNFAIRSETDLTAEIASAKANNLPEIALRRYTQELLEIRFSDSAEAKAITDLTMRVDPLSMASLQDVLSGLGSGYIQKWEAELHKNINIYIEEELAADSTFLTKPHEEQRQILVTKAKADVATNAPMTAEAILAKANQGNGGGSNGNAGINPGKPIVAKVDANQPVG